MTWDEEGRRHSRQRHVTFWENRQKPPQHKKFPEIFGCFGVFDVIQRLPVEYGPDQIAREAGCGFTGFVFARPETSFPPQRGVVFSRWVGMKPAKPGNPQKDGNTWLWCINIRNSLNLLRFSI
jgi:hypothetical protein